MVPAPPSAAAAPPWSAVRPPTRISRAVLGRRALAAAAVLAVFLLMVGPRLTASRAPWGVQTLMVWIAGRDAVVSPVAASSGTVRLRWAPAAGWALLTAYDLPPLPKGQVYEAWWVVGTRHVPAGIFRPTADGAASVWLPSRSDFAGVVAVGITREPAPGTQEPTGARQYFGRLLP